MVHIQRKTQEANGDGDEDGSKKPKKKAVSCIDKFSWFCSSSVSLAVLIDERPLCVKQQGGSSKKTKAETASEAEPDAEPEPKIKAKAKGRKPKVGLYRSVESAECFRQAAQEADTAATTATVDRAEQEGRR